MLNWKEVHKVLSEVSFQNSFIQNVTEHDLHSYTFSLFNKNEKAFMFYISIGSNDSVMMLTGKMREKSRKSQRFLQFLRSHVIGKRITLVEPLPFDRAFILHLKNSDESLKLLFRLYSGSGANMIVLDENDKILELMYRRPKRKEMPGETIVIEKRECEGERTYNIREYDTPTLSQFLDRSVIEEKKNENYASYRENIERKREKELSEIENLIRSLEKKVSSSSGFIGDKKIGDLLSANMHVIRKGMKETKVTDWESGKEIVIMLSPELSPSENIEHYYERYRKGKRSFEIGSTELDDARKRLLERKEYYDSLLSLGPEDIKRLRKEAENGNEKTENKGPKRFGLYIKNGDFDLIVGRNSKENDQILRHETRGSDTWMHTRDFPGGYVIIKAKKGKSIPPNILLDAANLALHFSQGKKAGKADLYYTEVKYLRRVKNGKEGLVIPTQEKNLSVTLDERRVNLLLGRKEDENIR